MFRKDSLGWILGKEAKAGSAFGGLQIDSSDLDWT